MLSNEKILKVTKFQLYWNCKYNQRSELMISDTPLSPTTPVYIRLRILNDVRDFDPIYKDTQGAGDIFKSMRIKEVKLFVQSDPALR